MPTPYTVTRPLCPLSPIELMIVRCIANGDTRAAAARAAGISPNSIQMTMARIFHKLGAVNAPSAVAVVLRHGWIA